MRIKKDWSYLGVVGMSERFEVVIVGSGAGGGVVAGELAERGRSVLLLEAGGHYVAADFMRWESRAAHDYWWPLGFAFPAGDPGLGPVVMISGRCVGGQHDDQHEGRAARDAARARQVARRHRPSQRSRRADLVRRPRPYYDRVERYLGVRDRSTDWDLKRCVQTAKRGFEAVGATLEPVRAYVDENCEQCGSCLQGCPTNAGKSTMNTYIQRNCALGRARGFGRTRSFERVLIEDRGDGARGDRRRVHRRPRARPNASRPTSSWSRPDRCARRRS